MGYTHYPFIKDKIKVDYFINGDINNFKKIGEAFLNKIFLSIYQPIVS
ncbi:MAG: hypothetical protein ACRCZO_14000 [Cetobacterium sp.]